MCMSLLILYPPDAGAEALARRMGGQVACLDAVKGEIIEAAEMLVLVSTDYYRAGCWAIKRWLSANADILRGKPCACCVSAASGELALRTIVSQLLSLACLVAPCATLCRDGILRPGGDGEALGDGWTPKTYYRKMELICALFRQFHENTLDFQVPLVG